MHPNWRAWASWVFLQVNYPVLNPSVFIFLSSVVSRLYALFVSILLLKIPVHQVFTWQQNNFLPYSLWLLSRWHLLKILQVEPVISENCQQWLWHRFLNCEFHLQIQYGSTIYFFFPLYVLFHTSALRWTFPCLISCHTLLKKQSGCFDNPNPNLFLLDPSYLSAWGASSLAGQGLRLPRPYSPSSSRLFAVPFSLQSCPGQRSHFTSL